MAHEPLPDRVARNLALMQRFAALVAANPQLAGTIPEGASLVLFDTADPVADPAKAQAAEQLEDAGKTVWRVSV